MRTSSIRAAALRFALGGALSACANAPELPTQQTLAAPHADVADLSTLTPLVCPSTTTQQSPVGFIGLLGGHVTFGSNELSVPLGALASLTAFQITLPAATRSKLT